MEEDLGKAIRIQEELSDDRRIPQNRKFVA